MNNYQEWIEKLELEKHPEGGYFKEVYRSTGTIPKSHLVPQFEGERNYCTSIYFLLTSEEFSSFHKIKSDELWYFHAGTAIEIYMIDLQGKMDTVKLGTNFEQEEYFQTYVPANTWFAAKLIQKESYALVSCSVAPGFDFIDFELGRREALLAKFPTHEKIIVELTNATQ